MNRKAIALVLIALALVPLALLAGESSYYPLRLDVVKVFSHSLGYRVVYRVGEASYGEAYLPITWFVPGGKAELVSGDETAYPYMVVFYKEGKVDHLRLFVKENLGDSSWGQISGEDVKDKFDVTDLTIRFK